jgi:thiamine-phosphate pyrophosphorylase
VLYAITDRRLVAKNEDSARAHLVELAAVWAANGVAFIQLREKDLSARDQVELARAMLRAIHAVSRRSGKWQTGGEEQPGAAVGRSLRVPRLLINGRADVALAVGADGVHVPAGPGELTPEEVRGIFAAAARSQSPVISVSCHTLGEVNAARSRSPDCILFAPVFEKVILENEIGFDARQNPRSAQKLPGAGLALLEDACRAAAPVPVFALGGVTADNAADCLRAGAAGVAAIRLMQQPASAWQHLA